MATSKEHKAKDEEAHAPAPAPRQPDAGLVVMVKDGERIPVHPSCVKAHEAVGWSVA